MKKFLVLSLCLVMIVSCFSGCGKNKNKDADRDTSLENYEISLENNLTNANATDAAKAVYNFICDMRGQYVISGQQESPSSQATEMNDIFAIAGTTPVLKGLDFINDDFENVTRRSITWWELGGLVSICWHMGTPPEGLGYESSKGSIDLKASLTEGTTEYKNLIAEFDKAVPYLKELQDAGVAVLWRPFHEADGAWFWWGKGGAENYIALWKLMYNYYTNDCGLNNLIWVCGLSSSVGQHLDWYPGDEYVDIFGADIYAKTDGSQVGLYNLCESVVEDRKPICLHENGIIPDADQIAEDGAEWSWFLTWHSEWLASNDDEYIKKIYNSENILAMNRMPKLNELIAAETSK